MCFLHDLFVFECLLILGHIKASSPSNANTQSPDVIAYLPIDYTTSGMSLCTNLAVYNQVKKVTTGECAFVLGQKKPVARRRVGELQTVF